MGLLEVKILAITFTTLVYVLNVIIKQNVQHFHLQVMLKNWPIGNQLHFFLATKSVFNSKDEEKLDDAWIGSSIDINYKFDTIVVINSRNFLFFLVIKDVIIPKVAKIK